MSIFSWADSKIDTLRWFDISLIKIGVFAFTLMLVKFFPQLTSLDWYWYLIVALLVGGKVWMKLLK